jgi:hypothetical protein
MAWQDGDGTSNICDNSAGVQVSRLTFRRYIHPFRAVILRCGTVNFDKRDVYCRKPFTMQQHDLHVLHVLACNFLMASLICFRCWEFWSLGGLEDFYNLLQNS